MNKVQFYPRRLFTSLPSLPSLPSLLYSFLLLCLQLFLFQLELRGLIGLVIEAFQFSNFILYIGIHQLVFTTTTIQLVCFSASQVVNYVLHCHHHHRIYIWCLYFPQIQVLLELWLSMTSSMQGNFKSLIHVVG